MLRVVLLLCLITITIGFTTEKSFAERLDKLYEKLEKLTVAPESNGEARKLYEKLDRFNSITPNRALSEDEELLSAMQIWGSMSDEQLQGLLREIQQIKEEKGEKIIEDYGDADWNDDDELSDGDYANDVGEEWDPIEEEISSTAKPNLAVTPSAFTRLDGYRHTIVSAVDPIAATNERPRILDDSQSTAEERRELRKAVISNMGAVVRAAKCLIPQPRWLTVRKLAPAADTVYMPPCVQLHRCAPDSGCCYNEDEVCAPVDGKYVAIPFFLNKADGNLTAARMLFFNHTKCACVSKETLQSTARTRLEERRDSRERQNDWRATEEPRCTCPHLFRSRIRDGICVCICDWPDNTTRRDCLSLARGREHFGLRDRVCIAQGNCNPPSCEYGTYERHSGRCPLLRRYKRRFHMRGRYQPDKIIV
ncbi:unnamed protein product [Leptosia nina]|uniref:Platelet-derived growth factor (PDGF) family profile domain-containing protein n=1 Tax=Leptosia nina TaxID=320188 RepID=A0AAV1IXD2_9NEOP